MPAASFHRPLFVAGRPQFVITGSRGGVRGSGDPDTQNKGTAEVMISKRRNGPTGIVRMAVLGEYKRFENLAHSGPGC